MPATVKWLSDDAIESEAVGLLVAASKSLGSIDTPPVPVEEILQFHLNLTLGLGDLIGRFGHKDVLGATWVPRREVIIDKTLDPADHPERLGRYLFTVGHEIGHWQLHREGLDPHPDQGLLFEELEAEPTVLCRTSQAKDRLEWQADAFSAYLLMPTHMVLQAWEERFGDMRPRTSEHFVKEFRSSKDCYAAAGTDVTDVAIDWAAREFAAVFQSSVTAMRIRLERLGLINRKQQDRLFAVEAQ